MSDATPVFVVVGNVNQGKSSIVAALAEDASVPMDPMPGTTVRSGAYVFKIGDLELFSLFDTPGFQDARRALAWMRDRSAGPTDRARIVREFVLAHAAGPRFEDEVRLLRPVVEGASILYVVDTSGPPQPSNEAEMEILRWTGQPRMALMNRTRDRDHAAEWRPYLEQYFNVVRSFDAHRAGFADRMNLLRSFREVREDWRVPMDRAITVLEAEQRSRRDRSAAVLAGALARMISHVERLRLDGDDEPPPSLADDLRRDFERALRGHEAAARTEIERLYRHGAAERREDGLDVLAADLFSDASWRLFGLTRGQLAQYGAAWGAALGGAVDLMVGGLTFFAGVAIGATVGGLTGFLGGTRVARTWSERSRLARLLFPGDTGRFLCMGPVNNPAFVWVMLDRALVHWKAVADRSHARQDAIDCAPLKPGATSPGLAALLPKSCRDGIDQAARAVLKRALKGRTGSDELASLQRELRQAFDAIASPPTDGPA